MCELHGFCVYLIRQNYNIGPEVLAVFDPLIAHSCDEDAHV